MLRSARIPSTARPAGALARGGRDSSRPRAPLPSRANAQRLGDLAGCQQTPRGGAEERQARKVISVKGTEALGWYQSFHKYDESVWGIYLDDFTISHIALDLRDRLAEANANGYADYAKALRAMIWLVAAHEWFHAQVDAAALLRELASSKPCFRAYFRHVYQQTINHPTALEEALANYEALKFVQQRLQELVTLEQWTVEERAVSLQFIQDLFDASPPGYADFLKSGHLL
jgi:hypothetical protein